MNTRNTNSVDSDAELQSQLTAALGAGYIRNGRYQELNLQAEKVYKIVTGLIKSTRDNI